MPGSCQVQSTGLVYDRYYCILIFTVYTHLKHIQTSFTDFDYKYNFLTRQTNFRTWENLHSVYFGLIDAKNIHYGSVMCIIQITFKCWLSIKSRPKLNCWTGQGGWKVWPWSVSTLVWYHQLDLLKKREAGPLFHRHPVPPHFSPCSTPTPSLYLPTSLPIRAPLPFIFPSPLPL